MKKKQLKTYAFVDASNIIYGASGYGWKMDFKKLTKYLKERYQVTRILYYAGVDMQNLKQLKFYEKLQEFGIELRLVPVKTFSDGRKKADIDSKMTFEMMLYFKEYDKAIIMTGDGDFFWVLEYLIRSKKYITLIAHSKTTAQELKKLFGGYFTDLVKIKQIVEYKNEADAFKGSASRDYARIIAKKDKKVKKEYKKAKKRGRP